MLPRAIGLRRALTRALGSAAVILAVSGLAVYSWASDPPQVHTCPECHCKCTSLVCVPTPTKEKASKHCWCVELKEICIPRLRFPWQSCEAPQCGRVRTVRVLKKVEYECEKCGYKWEVKQASCGCPE